MHKPIDREPYSSFKGVYEPSEALVNALVNHGSHPKRPLRKTNVVISLAGGGPQTWF